MGDPPMPQGQEQASSRMETGLAIAIDEGMLLRAGGPAMGDEGNATLFQESHPLVLKPGPHHNHRIGPAAVDQATVGLHLTASARSREQHEVEALLGKPLATGRQHVQEQGRTEPSRLQRERHRHRFGLAPAQTASGRVRPVVDRSGSRANALTGCRRHIGIAVESPRHRGDRQAQRLRKVLQVRQGRQALRRLEIVSQNVLESQASRGRAATWNSCNSRERPLVNRLYEPAVYQALKNRDPALL